MFTKLLLKFVQPTVKSPAALTKVPPELIIIPRTPFVGVAFTVTVVPEEMLIMSVQPGTTPPLQVLVLFQSPLAIDEIPKSAVAIASEKDPAIN